MGSTSKSLIKNCLINVNLEHKTGVCNYQNALVLSDANCTGVLAEKSVSISSNYGKFLLTKKLKQIDLKLNKLKQNRLVIPLTVDSIVE